MTEKRLIHGSYGEQRYLHSDEIFCKERNWNINLPSEREFKNGYCIITDKEDTAYSIDELVNLLNEFQKENEQLKQALLFFLDVANGQCSSSFQKDMEHDCQKLFNCSYSEAKDKYGDYDATWWELGE